MNAVRTIALAAALTIGFAGAAFARDPVFTATLDTPSSEARVIAQNAIWNCEGATCVARADHAVSVRACRQLVRETGGRVVSYGTEAHQLTAAEIARCNGETVTQQASN
ncbi:MAG TPA: hypothetical protein PLN53_14165 [Terricaulis sp.]|nr:hypothetical protein [Terricaulis sp.]